MAPENSSVNPSRASSPAENPYIIGRPIREGEPFFGREELFQFLTSVLLEGANAILISGQRRIGKSSVLGQIPSRVARDDFVFVPFDLQGYASSSSARILFDLSQAIATLPALVDRLPAFEPAAFEQDPSLFGSSFLPLVFQELGGRKLVLLLDEFDVLSNYAPGELAGADFFAGLQQIVRREPRLFVIAVVGRRLEELAGLLSLFSGAPHREIGLLDRESAEQLIIEPAQGLLEYTDDAIAALLELSAGQPYSLQLLCNTVFQRMRGESGKRVHKQQVERAVDRAIEGGVAGLAWFRDGVPVSERVVFSAVAEAQKGVPPTSPTANVWYASGVRLLLEDHGVVLTPELEQAEDKLLGLSYLRPAEPSAGYHNAVTIELVRRWLLKEHPVKRAMWELETLGGSAQAYEAAKQAHEQGRLEEALRLYEQVLQSNPNHFHALFGAAETTLAVGDGDQAVTLYARAHRVDPVHSEDGFVRALLRRGQELLDDARFEEGRAHFGRAQEIDPANPLVMKGVEEAEAGVRRALAVKNPFFVAQPVPPEALVGRRSEAADLLDAVRSGGHVALSGLPGMGKTSLLRFVASPDTHRSYSLDPAGAIVIPVDCESLVSFTPADFWREVLRGLRDRAEIGADVRGALDDAVRRPTIDLVDLEDVLGQVATAERRLVLLVDDFDAALRPDNASGDAETLTFLQTFRALAQRLERSLTTIVALTRRPSELGPATAGSSPWYNIFRLQALGPLTDEDVAALWARMPSPFGLSEEERTWAREVAGGYPYLVQAALSLLFRLHAEEKPFEIDAATGDFARAVEPLFSEVWTGATGLERLLLTLVALESIEQRVGASLTRAEGLLMQLFHWIVSVVTGAYRFPEAESLPVHYERDLQGLEQRGLLRGVERRDGSGYALTSSVMEWWVAQEIIRRGPEEFLDDIRSAVPGSRLATQLRLSFVRIVQNQPTFQAIEPWGEPLPVR